jgi:hemerythrin-like domain-containing protein
MPIQIGQRVDHGFDQPLGLLSDCHRRIEYFLGVLATVAGTDGEPLDPAGRRALESAIRYFAVAAPNHTADEEVSLFPRLRASGDRSAGEVLELLDRLEADHREADTRHAAIDVLARRWLEADRLTHADATALREHVARLQTLYQRHIVVEDREVFPVASRLLDRSQQRQIGLEMAARRQAPTDI